MQPEQTQGENPQMTADESAASLAFATHLQGQLMPQEDPADTAESPETVPGQEQPQETEKTPSFDPEAFKQEVDKSVKETIKAEMSSFKEELMSVLKEDDGENE